MKYIKYSLFVLGILFSVLIFTNVYQFITTKNKIKTQSNEIDNAYTVIVLGAKVYQSGTLSSYLQQRVDAAIQLYNEGKVERFLLSGDHGTSTYDEVNTMKAFIESKGIPSEDIFLDHAGFNTYNSMVRAHQIFEVNNCVIVSQDYHLPRAVYIANQVGLNAQGFAQNSSVLPAHRRNKVREILARTKSFLEVLFQLPPKYGGEKIPITGDSQLSYD